MAFSSKLSRISLLMALSAFGLAQPATAQEVILKGKDSQLNISGTLLSSSGGKFVVRTAIGEFEIEQSLVNCEGEGCPQVRDITYDLNLAGAGDIAVVLLPIIAEGFASTLDGETVLLDANGNEIDEEDAALNLGEGGKIDIEIVDYDGEEIANFGILQAEGRGAFEMLVSGDAPIVFTNDRATRKDRDFVEEGGGGKLDSYEQDHVIAVEGFAVVVNPKNNVAAISVEQAAQVMAGRITDWSELGGTPGPITLYSYDEDFELFHAIEGLLLEPYDYKLSPEADIVRNSGELSAAVMRNEAAFGIIDFHSKRGARAVPVMNDCQMTYYISPFSIKTEEYPLSHRVHTYSRPDLTGYAKDLVDYIGGPDLDGLVSKAGFVDLSVVADIQLDAAERVANIAAASEDAYERGFMETLMARQNETQRLSTTFRFAPGSNELDAKSQRDLPRMYEYLHENKPNEVFVVGFTDNKGSFDANILVAEQRAQEVIDQIRNANDVHDLDDVTFTPMGFGELGPVACNSDARGRATNRRVEIWVK